MVKVTKFLITISGLMLLFHFMGLIPPNTPNAILLNFLLDPSSFPDSTLFSRVIVVLNLVAAASVVVGAIFAQRTELIIVAPFTIFLFNLFFDVLGLYQIIAAEAPVIAILIVSPLMLAYIITVVEWFRGITT